MQMSLSRPRSPVATNGEEPPRKKGKKVSLLLPHTTISSLSDDLLLSCLARVSRLYYPTLSFVSKSFRSLLASPELYQTRSLLGRTESCLYVCLRLPPDPNLRWFTLCRKPILMVTNDTRKKKSSGYVLATLPIPHSRPAQRFGLVAVGSNIYNIGGLTHKARSSSVSIMDCRSHTWREAPSMWVERYRPAVTVLDGKIYVARGCKDFNSSNWMEVFDPKTQIWELVLSPLAARCRSRICKSVVIKEQIYMFAKEGLSYKPKEDRWEVVGKSNLDRGLIWNGYCVIDNVIYCHSFHHHIKWYDFKAGDWGMLKGLDCLPLFSTRFVVTLVNYGGKMVVLWDDFVPSDLEKKEIWCAVIALEKRNNEEIWGNVEWLDTVLTVPSSYELVCALAATV